MLGRTKIKDIEKMYKTCRYLIRKGYDGSVWKSLDRESVNVDVNPWGDVSLMIVMHTGYTPDENDKKVSDGEPVLGIIWKEHVGYYSAEVKENDFIRMLEQ